MAISFRDAASGAIANSLCTVLAVGDNVYRLFDWGLDPQGRGNVAAGVRRLLCNIDPDNDTQPGPPPFTGGQCPTRYDVTYSFEGTQLDGTPNSNTATASSPQLVGPLGQAFVGTDSSCGGSEIAARISTRGGTDTATLGCFGTFASLESVSVSSVAPFFPGVPDDCGDPPPEYPEPEPVEGPTINITYNIDESTQITVPLTAVFAPIFIKATGQFSFPIRVDIGGITFGGTFDVSPTINLNIYPDGSGGGNGGTTDKPDDDIPPIDIPDEDETPDFESRIIGVFIRSSIDTNAVRASGIPAGGDLPEIWAPRLANCQFLIRSRATTGWTGDIDVKNVNQYIPCPHPGGAVDVRVFPQQGVTVAVEPHRAAPLLPDLPPTEE
jgi:hypothetical protein